MGINFNRMKTKLIIFAMCINLVLPCMAQDDFERITMPDSTTRTFDELLLSDEDMILWLNSLSEEKTEELKNFILFGLREGFNQINSITTGGTLGIEGFCIGGIELDEEKMEARLLYLANEEILGGEAMKWLVENFNEQFIIKTPFLTEFIYSQPPGMMTLLKWLELKWICVLRSQVSDFEKRIEVPLYE